MADLSLQEYAYALTAQQLNHKAQMQQALCKPTMGIGTALAGASLGYAYIDDATDAYDYKLDFKHYGGTVGICTTNATDESGWYTTMLGSALPKMAQGIKKMVKFWRVNQIVEFAEGADIPEYSPLDDLRLKVARWLHKGEAWNLT